MARTVPTLEEAETAAAALLITFSNPDQAQQGRYKLALGLPLDSTVSYEMILKLVEIICELDQRIEVLETP